MVNADAFSNYPFGATASEQVDLNGIYELTGGVGPATLTFLVDAPGFQFGDQGSISCAIAFDGTSQTCGALTSGGPQLLAFTADYGVPFSVGLQIERIAGAESGEDTGGSTVTYSLSGPGLTLTPEPSSILLLLSGVVGVWFVTGLRVASR